jgi:hypothetical protein
MMIRCKAVDCPRAAEDGYSVCDTHVSLSRAGIGVHISHISIPCGFAPGVEGKILTMINDMIQHPSMQRGQVWCTTCNHTQHVDSGKAIMNGWPTHCGYAMTIDSPEERKRMERARVVDNQNNGE